MGLRVLLLVIPVSAPTACADELWSSRVTPVEYVLKVMEGEASLLSRVVPGGVASGANARVLEARLEDLRKKSRLKLVDAPTGTAADGITCEFSHGAGSPLPAESLPFAGGAPGQAGTSHALELRWELHCGISLLVHPIVGSDNRITLWYKLKLSRNGSPVAVGDQVAQAVDMLVVQGKVTSRHGEKTVLVVPEGGRPARKAYVLIWKLSAGQPKLHSR